MNFSTKEMFISQSWMSILGPKITCDIVHPGSSCIYEVVYKMAGVMKSSLKMYTIMYTFLFLLKLKKIRRDKKLKSTLIRTFKNFIGSLFFMSWLTGGMKTALCSLNAMGCSLDYKSMVVLSLSGSTSIFFEESSRRAQIGYFVFVRSLRSLYILLKKRSSLSLTNERSLCFILLFGLLSFLYTSDTFKLKNRSILEGMWGQA